MTCSPVVRSEIAPSVWGVEEWGWGVLVDVGVTGSWLTAQRRTWSDPAKQGGIKTAKSTMEKKCLKQLHLHPARIQREINGSKCEIIHIIKEEKNKTKDSRECERTWEAMRKWSGSYAARPPDLPLYGGSPHYCTSWALGAAFEVLWGTSAHETSIVNPLVNQVCSWAYVWSVSPSLLLWRLDAFKGKVVGWKRRDRKQREPTSLLLLFL